MCFKSNSTIIVQNVCLLLQCRPDTTSEQVNRTQWACVMACEISRLNRFRLFSVGQHEDIGLRNTSWVWDGSYCKGSGCSRRYWWRSSNVVSCAAVFLREVSGLHWSRRQTLWTIIVILLWKYTCLRNICLIFHSQLVEM